MGSAALRMLLVFGTGVAVGWFMSRKKDKGTARQDGEAQLYVVEMDPEPAPEVKAAPNTRVRCEAEKRDGSQCTRDSLPGSARCWQHTDE